MFKKIGLGLVALALMGGVAYAASAAQWNYYRSDLVRCANTTGGDDCGANVALKGADNLTTGYVLARSGKYTRLKLSGAEPNKNYKLYFVKLTTTISNPYDAANRFTASKTLIGSFTTKSNGKVAVKFDKYASSSARLGFFLIEDDAGLRQFATGIDQ